MAATVEVILIVQFPLPLLLRHDCVVVAVVIQDFFSLANCPDGADGRAVVVVVSDDVGVAAVVEKTGTKETWHFQRAQVFFTDREKNSIT